MILDRVVFDLFQEFDLFQASQLMTKSEETITEICKSRRKSQIKIYLISFEPEDSS